MRPFIVYCFIILSFFSNTAASSNALLQKHKVQTIIISGNRVTETSVVHYLANIKTGDIVDSATIAAIKIRLMYTGLFSKVDLLTLQSREGICLYILLTEKIYLQPYDLGGMIFRQRYGENKFWWQFRLGMQHSNFRGKAEVLRANFSFWDWRSLGLGWTKPLFPSPYYFTIGGSADVLPDEVFKIDHTILRSYAGLGRKLPKNSRIDLTFIPLYRRRIVFDSTLSPADTVRVYEAFTMLRFLTDHRNRFFDPVDGWLLSFDLKTNSLYTKIAPEFFQFSGDLRMYLPGLVDNHKIAMRATSVIRNVDAGITHRLTLGGEGSIRGYGRNSFGLYFYANGSLTFSCEYRFLIYQLPELSLYPLDRIHPEFSSITYRIDGALIFDYGRAAATAKELFSPVSNNLEEGTGIGLGLRVVVPKLEHTICYDVVWGTNPYSRNHSTQFQKQPVWHFYLDTYF